MERTKRTAPQEALGCILVGGPGRENGNLGSNLGGSRKINGEQTDVPHYVGDRNGGIAICAGRQ